MRTITKINKVKARKKSQTSNFPESEIEGPEQRLLTKF